MKGFVGETGVEVGRRIVHYGRCVIKHSIMYRFLFEKLSGVINTVTGVPLTQTRQGEMERWVD